MVSAGTLITTAVTVGLGITLGWNGWQARQSQREALSEAEEVAAEITTATASRSKDRDEAAEEGHVDYDYVPKLAFKYTFSGEQYESTNKYPPTENVGRGGHENKKAAQEWLNGYEAGQQVTAYVDPNDPGEAFLEAETNSVRNTVMIAVGGLLAGSGVLGIVVTVLLGL